MCLSTVYIETDHRTVEVMKNVTHMESENGGFLLIGILGEEKFVNGKIKRIDFIDQHSVVLANHASDTERLP